MNKIAKTLLVSVIVNIIVSILKIAAGILGNSETLLADGFHSISDLGTDIFGIIGGKISSKPADEEHPYGHGKIENIVSLGMGVIIIIIGVLLFKNSFKEKIMTPSLWIAIITIIAIVAKYFCSKYILKNGIKYSSSILISNAQESKMDVLSAMFVFIVIIISQFNDKIPWLKYIDIFGCFVISLIIVYTGLKIIYNETNELIGKIEKNKRIEEKIKRIVKNDFGQIKIKNLQLLKFGYKYLMILEIIMPEDLNLRQAHNIREELEKKIKLKEEKAAYIIIKILPGEELCQNYQK